MTKAESVLIELGFKKTNTYRSYEHMDLDSSDIQDLLAEKCASSQELLGQEVWEFSDGSYITRNEDDYFFDDDVREFEVTAELEAG